MQKKLGLYYRTIKHLKPIQIRYRLWYMLRKQFRNLTGHTYPTSIPKKSHNLVLVEGCPSSVIGHPSPKTFTFLNLSHTFDEAIDWNISKHGKLWAYNLNYFDYLHQPDISKEEGLKLIRSFIDQMEENTVGFEPYPISVRTINWIKFMSKHEVQDTQIDASLYAQYRLLLDNTEYHLLNNHLLENGCALLFGAYYFQDDELWQVGKKILLTQINEQILDDGGHYERSVMYHCIIMERLMDCYNLVKNNKGLDRNELLEKVLPDKLSRMLGWLGEMTGDRRPSPVPEFNDHVPEMTPSLSELCNYADRLDLEATSQELGESGYRKYSGNRYEVLVDIGEIGPDHVPGHGHADTFSFLVHIDGRPILTEAGTSTYEKNSRRTYERSTAAHNTVKIEGKEQSEVWGGFRVGRRAHVQVTTEAENKIAARHDGYEFIGIIHKRQFECKSDRVIIRDYLKGKGNSEKKSATFYLHFEPGIEIEVADDVIEGGQFRISFNNYTVIELDTYKKAVGYNKLKEATVVKVAFQGQLTTEIEVVDI